VGIFRSLQQRGIEKRDALARKLAAQGFSVIDDPSLCKKREIILNRGLDSPDSNFFVFLKTSFFGRTKVFFTDPSRGEGGKAFSKRELMRRFSSFKAGEGWTEKVVDEVAKASMAKSRSARFVDMHGHWGENEVGYGKERIRRDDGVSPRQKVIREMMLWHIDIDATGYHNWIEADHFLDISEKERKAGILKIPSLELTLPRAVPDPNSSNGPHLMLYFRSLESGLGFCEDTYDMGRKFPGMAPALRREEVLERIKMMRDKGELALGVAHPYGATDLGFRNLLMGILNDLELGQPLDYVKDLVRDYGDVVAIYNPTFSNKAFSFEKRPIVQAFFEDIITRYLGSNAKMTQNNVTYAFAMYCKHELGKRVYFEHDTHVYAGVPHYWRMVSPLAYGRTVIHFTDWEKAEVAFKHGLDLTPDEFIGILRRGRFERDGEVIKVINAKLSFDAFLEQRSGKLVPIRERKSPLRSIYIIPQQIKKAWQYFQLTSGDLRDRVRGMFN